MSSQGSVRGISYCPSLVARQGPVGLLGTLLVASVCVSLCVSVCSLHKCHELQTAV